MDEKQAQVPRTRLLLGGFIFISGFFSPLLIPLVLLTSWPVGLKSALSGLLALGIPELFMVIAAAIMGKSGFQYLKRKLYGLLKRFGPPAEVSPLRYRIGLVMFSLPLLVGFILPYFEDRVPLLDAYSSMIVIIGDVMFIVSLFVLGGDFWDKLRSLFIRRAKVVIKPRQEDQVS